MGWCTCLLHFFATLGTSVVAAILSLRFRRSASETRHYLAVQSLSRFALDFRRAALELIAESHFAVISRLVLLQQTS